MLMTHPHAPGRTVDVSPRAFRHAWSSRGWVEAQTVDVDRNVDQVLADVDGDPALASAALAAEQARDTPRTTLVEPLQRIAATGHEPTTTDTAGDGGEGA